MVKKIMFFTILIMLLCMLPLTADYNRVLDEIYSRKSAPLIESVWLILAGAEKINDTDELTVAKEYVLTHDISGLNLTRGQLAILLVENYKIPTGLMYKITKSPRYALRDIIYLEILGGTPLTEETVSGFELVNCLSIILEEEVDNE